MLDGALEGCPSFGGLAVLREELTLKCEHDSEMTLEIYGLRGIANELFQIGDGLGIEWFSVGEPFLADQELGQVVLGDCKVVKVFIRWRRASQKPGGKCDRSRNAFSAPGRWRSPG